MPAPTDPRAPIAAIVLAAGSSSRMGQPKQLLELDGELLLERSLRLARAVCPEQYLVLGAQLERIRKSVDLEGVQVVVNPDWKEGMGSSLRAGLRAAMNDYPDLRAALFLVVDQPLLTEDLLRDMLRIYLQTSAGIVAADYGPRTGVPALFDRAFFPELLNTQGDRGARHLLRDRPELVRRVPFSGGAMDIDTPDQWNQFRRNLGNAD